MYLVFFFVDDSSYLQFPFLDLKDYIRNSSSCKGMCDRTYIIYLKCAE